MKKNIILIKAFLFFITMLLQTLPSMAQADQKPTSYPKVKKSAIKNFEVKAGIHDHAFALNNGETWNVKISIPEIKVDEKVPLIIALHWAGDGKAYQEYADCLAFPALDTLNAIVIAPSAEGRHWVEAEMEKRVIHLVKCIKKYWPIDDEKIVVTGYSNGGIGSWTYAKKYPKLFCAAIPMSGFYTVEKIKIPVYAIHGASDELFSAKEIEEVIQKSIAKGSKIELDILEDFSHYMACAGENALRKSALQMKKDLW